MKRKVNLVGNNTLTVSLPSKWAEKHNVKKGDEVDLVEEAHRLILSKQGVSKISKKISLNIDNLNKLVLNRYIEEFYICGVEEITFKFSKNTMYDPKCHEDIDIYKLVKKLIERFIGMEIISQKNNSIILQTLMKEEDITKISVIEQRIFFLIKEFLEEFVNNIDYDFKSFFEKSYDYHDNISRFTYYYFRLLISSEIPDDLKRRLFELFSVIDMMIDKIRHASERVFEMKQKTKKIKSYVKEISDYFLEQFEIIFKNNYSIKDLNTLIKKRYELVEKINADKFTDSEYRVLIDFKILINTINPFVEVYVAKNIEQYIEEIY